MRCVSPDGSVTCAAALRENCKGGMYLYVPGNYLPDW